MNVKNTSSSSGKLLDEIQILDTPMGIRYERAISPGPSAHQYSRIALLCPRGASRIEGSIGREKPESFKIDSKHVAWIPGGSPLEFEARSVILDLTTLWVSAEYFAAMIEDNGLTANDRSSLETKPRILKRTKWLDDILDRYFFERVLNRQSPPGCTFFLEKQIINELARIFFREKLLSWESKPDDAKEGFDAALRFIEANLFEKLDLERIADVAKLSESTLLRYFKNELGKTPYAYVKERRLDEALELLTRRAHSVSDVAILVGYEDFSSFSKAFRERFGKKPSEVGRAVK